MKTVHRSIAIVLLAAAFVALPVISAGADPGCVWDVDKSEYKCDGEEDSDGNDGSSGGGSGPTTTRGYSLLWVPTLVPGPDGLCIDTSFEDLGREPSQADHLQSELQFFRYLRAGNPICPDAEIPPGTTPPLEAARFLDRIGLPSPTPYIEPGRLPVGLDAYLEVGAPTTQTYGPEPTPFGDLTLTTTAELFVDWDDPHDDVDGEEGPFVVSDGESSRPARPGPHPDGEITHLYQYDGLYEIRVRMVWTATWSIGTDHSGTIDGAETSGVYPAPGFEVFSRQAVG